MKRIEQKIVILKAHKTIVKVGLEVLKYFRRSFSQKHVPVQWTMSRSLTAPGHHAARISVHCRILKPY